MAFIHTSTPPTVNLYLTSRLSEETLAGLRSDFGIGAHEGYNTTFRLQIIDNRSDLLGLGVEDCIIAIKADPGSPRFFLIAAAESDRWKALWVVNTPGTTSKIWVAAKEASIILVNIQIGNMPVEDFWTRDYDPSKQPAEPILLSEHGFETQRPQPAYLTAGPAAYVECESTTMFGDGRIVPKYKLTPEWAARLRVISKPSIIVTRVEGSLLNDEYKRKMAEAGIPEEDFTKAVVFTQEWDWQPS